MTNPFYEKSFEKAITDGAFSIKCKNAAHAIRFRQRLYRIRDQLREETENPLSLLADDFRFLLDGKVLTIEYSHQEDIEAIQESMK